MKKIVLISLAILMAVPSWGQTGVYKKRDTAPQDGTITTSITKKRTNIEIQEIEKKPKEDFRRGWQIEAEIPAVLNKNADLFMSPKVSVGYLLNHWYVGLVGGYCNYSSPSRWGPSTQNDSFEYARLGIRGRYYFGKGRLTPFVGINVCGQLGHEYLYWNDSYYLNEDICGHLGIDLGVKYYLTDHLALGMIIPVYLQDSFNRLEIGLGVSVSYLF